MTVAPARQWISSMSQFSPDRAAFDAAYGAAIDYRQSLGQRPPRAAVDPAALKAAFSTPLPDRPRPARQVIDDLVSAASAGLMANSGPNFFGWVMGASHPAGVAADWLTAAWGQNAGIYQTSPAAAAAEDAVARWLLDLFGLPRDCGFGLTTGATMAGFTCLTAARNTVLARAGWDIEERGVFGAPPITVLLGAEAHSTIFAALRYLGFGEDNILRVTADDEGRMVADDLKAKLARCEGPTIIIAQAGHINSGAFDPFTEIADIAAAHGAWLHVDGAFGLWARAVERLRPLADGVERADSWSVDGHKWLQAPYDTGFAIVRDADAHRRAMRIAASYLGASPDGERDPSSYAPELSRRARGFGVWAVMQALGREGITEMIERHCACAQHLKARLADEPGVEFLNQVVLNQAAIAFRSHAAPGHETLADKVIEQIQKRNRCFVAGAEWKGRKILRISIISADTDIEHVDLLADEIIAAWRAVRSEL